MHTLENLLCTSAAQKYRRQTEDDLMSRFRFICRCAMGLTWEYFEYPSAPTDAGADDPLFQRLDMDI